LEDQVKNCHDLGILSDWYKLQNSDHFYYMCTKWFSDGDVHKYFNPYSSPYDAFINYMNVLSDFIIRVNKKCPLDKSDNEKFIEKTEELGREIQAAAAKKVKAATAKVKAAYETQKNKSYSFEEIKSMSNAKIRQIAKEVDVENWVYALKDAGDELTGKIIPNLTKNAAREYDKLKDELKVRKADIKKSRDKIGEEISRLFRKK